MTKLFAFDRDSTTENSGGPVKLQTIRNLKEQGHVVVGIGNILLDAEVGIPSGRLGLTKQDSLKQLREAYPRLEDYLVIDDDPSVVAEGWTHFSPQEFAAIYQ